MEPCISSVDVTEALGSGRREFLRRESTEKVLPNGTKDLGFLQESLLRDAIMHFSGCKHPNCLSFLVVDGNTDLHRKKCAEATCGATPRRGCDWCGEHHTERAAVDLAGKFCLYKTQASHNKRFREWTVVLKKKEESVGGQSDPASSRTAGMDKVWLLGTVSGTVFAASQESVRDGLTAAAKKPASEQPTTFPAFDLDAVAESEEHPSPSASDSSSSSDSEGGVGDIGDIDSTRPFALEEPSVQKKKKFSKSFLLQDEENELINEEKLSGVVAPCVPKQVCCTRKNRTHGHMAWRTSCNYTVFLTELTTRAEGARVGLRHLAQVLKKCSSLSMKKWFLVEFADCACFYLQSALAILVERIQSPGSEPDIPGWIMLVFVGIDRGLDELHETNHAENSFCRKIMATAPRRAYLEKRGSYTDQVVEEFWATVVPFAKMARYMAEGEHRSFMLLVALLLNIRQAMPGLKPRPLNVKTMARKRARQRGALAVQVCKQCHAVPGHSVVTKKKAWDLPHRCLRQFPGEFESMKGLDLAFVRLNAFIFLRCYRPLFWFGDCGPDTKKLCRDVH
mmetsp:Transcript_3613/g.11884  ORF Transcript_3613/g.11884 Transcript_3613/m.11884 type:complete len:565 (+) Transcript_3613:76-1770(+)